MTCRRELKQLKKNAVNRARPIVWDDQKSYLAGYADGFEAALDEALEIVEAHEEEEE